MQSRERPIAPADDLPAPVHLPSLTSALSRRASIFGAVAAGGLWTAGSVAVAVAAADAPAIAPADADLIELAVRTVALARHQEQVADQVSDVQGEIDRWSFANKPAVPMLPDLHSRTMATDLSTSSHRVTQFSVPIDESEALAAACLDYREAREAHKRAVADRVAASSVPSLTALSDRLWQNLIHSVEHLVDMEPRTLAGLAAKASVIEALSETDSDIADWWGQNLLRSVAQDVMRLHTSSVLA